jgi:phosphoribosylglycinamide formyltransferase-1
VIGVLVSGSGTNLQALLDAGLPVVAVASNRPGVLALDRAELAGVASEVFELEAYPDREARDLAMADWLEEHGTELVVCAGYMHLLTQAFLERFRCVNVHPSLLPDFPGAHAVEETLAAGVSETGVTVHFVDEGVDTGPVIAQERVAVEPGDTPDSLHWRLQAVEHRLLPEVVGRYLAGSLRSA